MPRSTIRPAFSKPFTPVRNMYEPQQVRNDMANNGFTSYAAGRKHYGTGRMGPNMGTVADKTGYAMRDGKAAARRQALMRRMGNL